MRRAKEALRSDDFQRVLVRKRWELCGGKRLVPVGDGGDVVLKGKVAPALAPAERLNRHAQPAVEVDRIRDVPPVHPKPELAAVQPVRLDDLQPRVRRRERQIAVVILRILKVVRAAEVILRPRAADGGKFSVAV